MTTLQDRRISRAMDEDGFLHLTDVGREVAERTYEKHCFFTEMLIEAGVDQETAEAGCLPDGARHQRGQLSAPEGQAPGINLV